MTKHPKLTRADYEAIGEKLFTMPISEYLKTYNTLLHRTGEYHVRSVQVGGVVNTDRISDINKRFIEAAVALGKGLEAVVDYRITITALPSRDNHDRVAYHASGTRITRVTI